MQEKIDIKSFQNALKEYMQITDQKLKDKLQEDGFPVDIKFGQFEFNFIDDHYELKHVFYINDVQNDKNEMIELSKVLTQFYKERNNGIN
ncbi:hypothetical protein [Halarcobacter sp.]|uniref:hypothetical protein n=1 Tax=Halarcobacter sp. TaxID=2321133 RepID=UPI003A93FE05